MGPKTMIIRLRNYYKHEHATTRSLTKSILRSVNQSKHIESNKMFQYKLLLKN